LAAGPFIAPIDPIEKGLLIDIPPPPPDIFTYPAPAVAVLGIVYVYEPLVEVDIYEPPVPAVTVWLVICAADAVEAG